LVHPWKIDTVYPYSKEATFIVPPDRPFFDTMTCLAFLAGCTEKIELGMSVMVMPYRHPLHWARIATTIDQLSSGRLILGVGVGWMEEEFAAMKCRSKNGGDCDEQLTPKCLTDEHITSWTYYNVDDTPSCQTLSTAARANLGRRRRQMPSVRRPLRRRLVSYFVKPRPRTGRGFETSAPGQLAGAVIIACCLPVELTPPPGPITDYLKASNRSLRSQFRPSASHTWAAP
jgi:hypothetical protein